MTSNDRSLLVTGGAGFIGANFVHFWRRQHPRDRIVVVDALTYAGNRTSISSLEEAPGFTFVHGNITDRSLVESILRQHRVDTVVHFAAESHVDRSIRGPELFLETNVIGTHVLLTACRQAWLEEGLVPQHRFHHISTDEVYGSLDPGDTGFSEATPYAPSSPYAASKAAADHLVRAYHRTYGLEVTTTNCSNNYGPFHFPEKLIPLIILNILEGRPLPIYGDGQQVRDWLHVTDHCRAIELVLKQGRPGETYNVGGRAEATNLSVVESICEIADEGFRRDPSLRQEFAGSPCARGRSARELVQFVTDRPGHDRRYAIDPSKIERELGFTVSYDLRSGLEETFQWFLDNSSWWRSILDGSYRNWLSLQYGSDLKA